MPRKQYEEEAMVEPEPETEEEREHRELQQQIDGAVNEVGYHLLTSVAR